MFFKLPIYLNLKTALEAIKRLVSLPEASNLAPLINLYLIEFNRFFLFVTVLVTYLFILYRSNNLGTFTLNSAFFKTLNNLFFLFFNFKEIDSEYISLLKCIDFKLIIFNSTFFL